MKLSDKVLLARRKGFTKGMKWFWWLRIVYALNAIIFVRDYFLTFDEIIYYTDTFPSLFTFIYMLYFVVFTLYGIGIYGTKPIGYTFVIIFMIANPIFSVALEQAAYMDLLGEFYFNDELVPYHLYSVVWSALNLYYFHNRKILFEITSADASEESYCLSTMANTDLQTAPPAPNTGNATPSYSVDITDETLKITQSILRNKELRLLFDTAQYAPPEDLRTVHQMLLALQKKERIDIS